MNKVILDGYDSNAESKELTISICYEEDKDGTKTVTFEEMDFTCDIKDLLDAIEFLKTH